MVHVISYPLAGTIPLKRVKYSSKQETDAINNFKILQSAFKKLNVDQVKKHPVLIIPNKPWPLSERWGWQAGEGEVPGQLWVPPVVQEVLWRQLQRGRGLRPRQSSGRTASWSRGAQVYRRRRRRGKSRIFLFSEVILFSQDSMMIVLNFLTEVKEHSQALVELHPIICLCKSLLVDSIC